MSGIDPRETLPAATEPAATAGPAGLGPGVRVDQFRIKRLLGAGGMGQVYLARDEVLGRSVAIKVVRTDRLTPPRAEQLLREARLTARLNHPHIVTVYAVGTFQGQTYLALEHLDGVSLDARLAAERLSLDAALRLLRAVSEALAHAHAHGVLHRDLKPANVIVPKDGRARVVDFGLAVAGELSVATPAGTPSYMAPEQWRGGPLGFPADVWAFGVLAFEALLGRHPFGHDAHPERAAPPFAHDGLSAPLRALLEGCLARDPAARPPAQVLLDALEDAISRTRVPAAEDAPFRGLLPFTEAYAGLYFGRDADIDGAVEQLRDHGFLAVVGPSGAGKTSFVRAGVVPRLARDGWAALSFRPGVDPFRALAAAVAGSSPQAEAPADLAAAWRASPGLVHEVLRPRGRLLLHVDQLEELFTHGATVDTQRAFLELLRMLSDDPLEPLRVVVTLRDDFLGRCPDIDRVLVLRPLGASQAREAIVRPLERAGYGFDDPALPDAMLAELGERDIGLPVLQFTCRLLWDHRDRERHVLTRAAYEALGGLTGALATHADRTLETLDVPRAQLARRILTALANPDGTRHSRDYDALAGPDGAAVIDHLVDARLLVVRLDRESHARSVDVAHESLLHRWERLRRWLEESHEERRLLAELDEAAQRWERRGRRADETWAAEEVADTRRRLKSLLATPSATAAAFLAAGEQRARQRARLRAGVVSAVVLGSVLLTTAAVAVALELRAREQQTREQAEGLRLAGNNIGRFTLVLTPFAIDADALTTTSVSPALLPELGVRLHFPASGDLDRAGLTMNATLSLPRAAAEGLHVEVEAPGGPAYLELFGRGVGGDRCGSAWVRVLQLPGYEARAEGRHLTIPVATCAASRAGMIQVQAGPYIDGGPGEPPLPGSADAPSEREVVLATYYLDKTEVPNALYRVYGALEHLTGRPAPRYPAEEVVAGGAAPDHPTTAIDAATAESYCRFLGRRLPTIEEWRKAARGGVQLGGVANSLPRRPTPWGDLRPERMNTADPTDRWPNTNPVFAFTEGAGPYGHLDLVGNVSEWTVSRFWSGGLRIIAGGDWATPTSSGYDSTVFENRRDERFFSWSIGLRCAADPGALGAL